MAFTVASDLILSAPWSAQNFIEDLYFVCIFTFHLYSVESSLYVRNALTAHTYKKNICGLFLVTWANGENNQIFKLSLYALYVKLKV